MSATLKKKPSPEKRSSELPAQRSAARRKEPPLRLYCLPAERATIEANASMTGKSVSAFLRAVGIGMVPQSRVDQQAVKDLLRVNADLGRLGGLLKALLTHDERFDGYTGRQLQELTTGTLKDVQAAQARIQECLSELFSR